MAIIKTKLDFTDPINLESNYLKILIDSDYNFDKDFASVRAGELSFRSILQDCVLVDASSIVGKTIANRNAAYTLEGGEINNIIQDNIENNLASDMPQNIRGIAEGCQYIYTVYPDAGIETDEFSVFSRQELLLSDIVGLDANVWLCGFFETYYGTNSEGNHVWQGEELKDALNNATKTYAEYYISYYTVNNSPSNIPDQYPLPADFVGGYLPTKTTAEIMNEYLKLYQKTQVNQQSMMYSNSRLLKTNTQIESRLIGSIYYQNISEYNSSESNSDGVWQGKTITSELNGDTVSNGSNWDMLTFDGVDYSSVNEFGIITFNLDSRVHTVLRETVSNGNVSGSRSNNFSSQTSAIEELYFQLPPDINGILNLQRAVESDGSLQIFAEFHIQVIAEINVTIDSYDAYELNNSSDGVVTVEQRETDDTGFKGIEKNIKGLSVFDEKVKVDIMKLKTTIHTYADKIGYSGPTLEDILSTIGEFNQDTNPFGYIKGTGISNKIQNSFINFIPADVVVDPQENPASIISYTTSSGQTDVDTGLDQFDFTIIGSLHHKTAVNFYQIIDGLEIPIISGFLSKREKSFDYS